MVRLIVPALVFLLAGNASAKDLRILTGAGMAVPLRAMAADFGARTGDHVTVISDTAGGVQKRMQAGEPFDLVIATQAVMDALTQQGKVAPIHINLAQMVAGIGVRKGQPKPAIANASQVRATLVAAKTISYVDPAFGGITGVFFLQQADKLGIGAKVRTKAILKSNGSGVADAVASGQAQYGVTLVSELSSNKEVAVWPLPNDMQMTTIYAAAHATDAENAMDADRLLEDLRSLKGRQAYINAGLKPIEN